MTNMEKALLFGSVGAGALSSAVGANRDKKSQAASELDSMVQRQLAALQNKQQTGQTLQDSRQQGWKDQTSQSPLGGEQSFLQKQRLAQVLFPQIANFKPAMPTDPGVAGAYTPPTNILGAFGDPRLLDTFSDQATATSLADRRKLMAGLNPDYEFSSLGNFGLDSSFDQGVNRAQQDAAGRRQAYEQTQTSLANQQHELAGQAAQQPKEEEKKGGGIKGFLGGVLKAAAPFANFIPGVGPIAAIGLGAAGGALGNKMQGGGLVSGAAQGALGAGIGAAGKSLAGGQGLNPFNNSAGKVLNNAMTSASLPVGNMVSQQTTAGLPSKGFDMTKIITGGLQGNNQSQPQQGGGSRPPQPVGPVQGPPALPSPGFQQPNFAPSHQQGQQQPQPSGWRSAPTDLPPSAQAAFEDLMNSGIGKGFSDGGWNMGGMANLLPVMGAGRLAGGAQAPQLGAGAQPRLVGSGSTPQALNAGPQLPKQLGPGQYNAGPVGSSSISRGSTFNLPAQSGSTVNNQQNAQNIMQWMSQQPPGGAGAMNMLPEVQQIFRQLATTGKIPAGMTPQQLMQMIVRGGG